MTFDEDGSLILHSSATGALGVVPPDKADHARDLLKPGASLVNPTSEIEQSLIDGGMLVPATTDERWESHKQYVGRYNSNALHLIVLPTEDCNFRCVYCYESFLRGAMSQELQDGLIKYIEQRPGLTSIELSWFGGEPLLAKEVVLSIMRRLRAQCEARDVRLSSGATTNGYLLTPELADELIPLGVDNFQITLDGVEHEHNQRRPGVNGEDTFAVILSNLRYLASSDHKFTVMIRHNFDPNSLPRLEELLNLLSSEFGSDRRFIYNFESIGQWGGENDATLPVCDSQQAARAITSAKTMALDKGLRDPMTLGFIQPNGTVCYAANPNSFVIGSDGKVYKCTVELDYHDRNIVGQLHTDGTMELDWRKMALWCETNGQDEGKKCTTCWFSPSCQGAICPKAWMDENDCDCPPMKRTIKDTLTFIRADAVKFGPPSEITSLQCGK